MDLINRAYLHKVNDKVWLMTAINLMPMINEDKKMLAKFISITGSTLFPFSLSLLLPIFMYIIVHEKEEKLIMMMRMNGLRMSNYWLVNYIFMVSFSLITYTVFYIAGYWVFELNFFTDTDPKLLAIILYA